MSDLDTELFIRRQVQRILLREEKEETTEEKPKRRGPGKVLGGTGQGNYPNWVKEIFAGEDGSVAKAKRLAASNPGKLMSNIGARNGHGETTLDRANNVVEGVRRANKVFGEAIGQGEEQERSGKKGYFYPNAGLPQDRQSTLFVFDTVRAAATVGYIKMDGHIRIEPYSGGTIMYQVENDKDRWN